MTIHLPSDQEQFVRSLIDAGQYSSEDAIVNEALRLLQQRDEASTMARMRLDIAENNEQADGGDMALCAANAALACIRSRQAWAAY
jgi:putative addiction module CopG family antidote